MQQKLQHCKETMDAYTHPEVMLNKREFEAAPFRYNSLRRRKHENRYFIHRTGP